jgi:ABC-type polysaccharide/polyol phosphate export permease
MKTVNFYAKNNGDKGFANIVRSMRNSALSSFYAGRSLCFKQVAAERTKSALAPIWDLAEPLLIGLTFVMLYRSKVLDQPGILAWQCLVDAITIPMKIIISSRELLLNTQVPPEALMWSCLIRTLYNLLFKVLIIWGFAIAYGYFNVIGVILSTSYLVLAVILTASIGFLLSPFNAIAEDTLRAEPYS